MGSLAPKSVLNAGLSSCRIGAEMMLPKEEVDRESLRGELDDEAVWPAFLLRMKMKARTPAMINTTAPAAAPPAIPAIGGPADCGTAVAVSVSDGLAVVDGFDVGVVEGLEDGVLDCEGAAFWLVFMTHSPLTHEYPNGQQSEPHFGREPPRAVVLMTESGALSAS